MTVELHRAASEPLPQTLQIRKHALPTDTSVEEGANDAGANPYDELDAALA